MKRICFSLSLLWVLSVYCNEAFWKDAKDIQRGVKLVQIDRTEPRLQKISIIRVDLSTPGICFTGTERDPQYGEKMPDFDRPIRTKRHRTRNFMLDSRNAGNDMIVAMNTTPWVPWCKPFTHAYSDPVGVCITNGVVISDDNSFRANFYVDKAGKPFVTEEIPRELYPEIQLAAGGFGIILLNGQIQPGGGYEAPLMPRAALGISQDKRYIYLITIDGRQPGWSLGATGREVTDLLVAAGAWDAIDFDGGGSATLCYWDAKENKVVAVSRQTEKYYERPVAVNMGIIIKDTVRFSAIKDFIVGLYNTLL